MGSKCSAESEIGRKNRMKNVAIVLAAGRGKRMNSSIQKQYLLMQGKPVLYYSLEIFEKSDLITDVILVTGKEECAYCWKEVVEKYHLQKIRKIVAGGKERYHSVYEGLKAAIGAEYVYIHDGARPFIDQQMIQRSWETVQKYGACVVGMPVKDTIKVADTNGYAVQTPDRRFLWSIQTPQVFRYDWILDAYEKMLQEEPEGITDDAMVLETMTDQKVKVIEGSYRNIKITTPEDMEIAEIFLKNQKR